MPTQPPQPPQNHKILKVTVRNRQKAVYDDEAFFVQSINEKGDFAVLGEHTNFISIVKSHLIIGKTDKTSTKIDLSEQAVLKVNKNIVEVYLGLTEGGTNPVGKTAEVKDVSVKTATPQKP